MLKSLFEWLSGSIPVSRWTIILVILALGLHCIDMLLEFIKRRKKVQQGGN